LSTCRAIIYSTHDQQAYNIKPQQTTQAAIKSRKAGHYKDGGCYLNNFLTKKSFKKFSFPAELEKMVKTSKCS